MKSYQNPTSVKAEEEEKNLLRWNGISYDKKSKRYKRKYRLYVYKLESYAIYQAVSGNPNNEPWTPTHKKVNMHWRKLSTNLSTRELLKVKDLAQRTLYILGYEHGMVEITVMIGTSFKVVKISNGKVHQSIADKMNAALHKSKKEQENQKKKNKEAKVKLGADLELALRHSNGKYVLASSYFSKRGEVGHDAIWLKGNRSKYPLLEFRPLPSEHPLKLYRNILKCMKIASKKINNNHIEWLAGGRPLRNYPIGGHIHFSRIKIEHQLLRALDNYITLPLFLLESKESLSRRPKYGFLGDYRVQFHGGFEYRTPPSWIAHPHIARGIVALAKVIGEDYEHLSWMPLLQYDTQQDFYQGNKEAIYPLSSRIKSELSICPTYATYQEDIELFFNLIEKKYVWNEYEDIRKAWKIPPYSK